MESQSENQTSCVELAYHNRSAQYLGLSEQA